MRPTGTSLLPLRASCCCGGCQSQGKRALRSYLAPRWCHSVFLCCRCSCIWGGLQGWEKQVVGAEDLLHRHVDSWVYSNGGDHIVFCLWGAKAADLTRSWFILTRLVGITGMRKCRRNSLYGKCMLLGRRLASVTSLLWNIANSSIRSTRWAEVQSLRAWLTQRCRRGLGMGKCFEKIVP